MRLAEFMLIIVSSRTENASLLFFKDNKIYITKVIDNKLITKEATKDTNYSGNRYIWKEDHISAAQIDEKVK